MQENKNATQHSRIRIWTIGALGVLIIIFAGIIEYSMPRLSNVSANVVSESKIQAQVGIVNGDSTKTYSAILTKGATAYDMLQEVARANSLIITAKDYSGKPFVTGIGGIEGDDKHYWSFEINGAASNVGAGDYVVQTNDVLTFRFTAL